MILYGANGKRVDADSHGRLLTRAVTRAELNDASTKKKTYSIVSGYTTSGGDEEIVYIKNTHATDDFEIHHVVVGTAVNAVFTISKVTGTAGGAGAITPAALNVGQNETADLSCTGDASVTGLTLAATLAKIRVIANYSDMFNFEGSIILQPNTAIAVSNSATGACEITIVGHFNSLED